MKELKEGDKAPSFLELAANKGSTIVVYFYPKDFTPGCTTEACEFRDLYEKIQDNNAVVIGISPDSPESKEKSMYGKKYMGIERSTFVIGPDGALKKIFRKVKAPGHAEEVLSVI